MTWWLRQPIVRCACGAHADPMIGQCFNCYERDRYEMDRYEDSYPEPPDSEPPDEQADEDGSEVAR